jgi:hypothetical protein
LYLQPKLNLKVSQRQVLTPGLVQMVSVLALNKLELKDMINSEMIENPVLEEVEESAATLDERSGIEGDRERSAQDLATEREEPKEQKDPFDEIDFGSYFQDYLDPGFKTASNFEEYDKPSFEHFLSQPSTLSDHLLWQLGSLTLKPDVRAATELIVGNLDDNGYLTASDEELAEAVCSAGLTGRIAWVPKWECTRASCGDRGGAGDCDSRPEFSRERQWGEWAFGDGACGEFAGAVEGGVAGGRDGAECSPSVRPDRGGSARFAGVPADPD